MSKSILAAFCMQIVLWRNIKIVPRLVLRPNYDPGSAPPSVPGRASNKPSRSYIITEKAHTIWLKWPTSAFTFMCVNPRGFKNL